MILAYYYYYYSILLKKILHGKKTICFSHKIYITVNLLQITFNYYIKRERERETI